MNWWTIFQAALTIASSLEAMYAEIEAGQPASSPPVNTYIGGKHGSITLTWQPLP